MIKNIIFDVGDVLFEYRWKAMFMDHGLSEEKALAVGTSMFEDPMWKILDLAMLTHEEVTAEYVKKYPQYAADITWFLNHGEYMHVKRTDVWAKVHTLKKKGYKIYLLSNYSENLFEKHTKNAAFLNDIDGMVVSYQVHMAKPDERIYRYLLEKYHLQEKECVFFDDKEENTEAARKLGMEAITVTSKEQLLENLDTFIGK